jgi:hypothetical protein
MQRSIMIWIAVIAVFMLTGAMQQSTCAADSPLSKTQTVATPQQPPPKPPDTKEKDKINSSKTGQEKLEEKKLEEEKKAEQKTMSKFTSWEVDVWAPIVRLGFVLLILGIFVRTLELTEVLLHRQLNTAMTPFHQMWESTRAWILGQLA